MLFDIIQSLSNLEIFLTTTYRNIFTTAYRNTLYIMTSDSCKHIYKELKNFIEQTVTYVHFIFFSI